MLNTNMPIGNIVVIGQCLRWRNSYTIRPWMFITSKISQGLSQAFNQTKVLDATFIVWNGFFIMFLMYTLY